MNGEVHYQVQLALSNSREDNVKESQLRKMRKAKSKPNKGEGIYHWEGMTDDEDDEWNPAGRGTRSAEGSNVEKDRLHFGHFEQLVLLFMKFVHRVYVNQSHRCVVEAAVACAAVNQRGIFALHLLFIISLFTACCIVTSLAVAVARITWKKC